MKTIEEILNSYEGYRTTLEDRFGKRLCSFLTEEQAKRIGFGLADGYEWGEIKDFTEDNVIEQLKSDVKFGYEKAINERGISAGLMYEVVKAWLAVLEDKRDYPDYYNYGREFFKKVANNYGVILEE